MMLDEKFSFWLDRQNVLSLWIQNLNIDDEFLKSIFQTLKQRHLKHIVLFLCTKVTGIDSMKFPCTVISLLNRQQNLGNIKDSSIKQHTIVENVIILSILLNDSRRYDSLFEFLIFKKIQRLLIIPLLNRYKNFNKYFIKKKFQNSKCKVEHIDDLPKLMFDWTPITNHQFMYSIELKNND